jgi:hypothetical protein
MYAPSSPAPEEPRSSEGLTADELKLDIPQIYSIESPNGKSPWDIIDGHDHHIMRTIFTLLARACNSTADVVFSIYAVTNETTKQETYAVNMYVEANTEIEIDNLNVVTASYPNRIFGMKIRTMRRPKMQSVFVTCVHLRVYTYEFAAIPSRVDICHIYSPPIPLQRNVITGMFARIADAGDGKRGRMPSRERAIASPLPQPSQSDGMLSWFSGLLGGGSKNRSTWNNGVPDYIIPDQDNDDDQTPPIPPRKRPRT